MNDTDPRTLLELYLLGELDDAEAARVRAWLAERPGRHAQLEAARRAHAALSELLAPPPDAGRVAERIVARLAARQRRARLLRLAAAAAAVAAAALALALLPMLPRRRPAADLRPQAPPDAGPPAAEHYPEPRAKGTYLVYGGGALTRGALVRAGADGAVIELGGYCRVELAPDSVLRLAGSRRQEAVFLEEGTVACEVDIRGGAFGVETELCSVSALGTGFVVQLSTKGGEVDAPRKVAYVQVLTGAALVSSPWGQQLVAANP